MLSCILSLVLTQSAVTQSKLSVTVGGKKISAQVVTVVLDRVKIKVVAAHDRVGSTEALKDIAKRYKAVAAINGSFFEAYRDHPIKSPNHNLISDGRLLHKGSVGSTLGFDARNQPRIDQVLYTIHGTRTSSSGGSRAWVAYWINRFPTSATVTLFTPDWGAKVGLADGSCVVVSGSKVSRLVQGDTAIPSDGFVIYFRDSMLSTYSSFQVGDRVEYEAKPNLPEWTDIREAVGAGPMLVERGQVAVDAAAEGFRDPKILSGGGTRSAIGFTADGQLKLVATSGTMAEVAGLMKSLGCVSAMNLDGGASSGLWYSGKYLREPGRQISNALLILP